MLKIPLSQQVDSSPLVQIEPGGLRLADGKRLAFFSGAIHYWRLARSNWSAILDSICEMGFSIIETYVPWSVHEVDSKCYDFGERDPAKDLDAFLTLCQAKDLYVFLRPGPNTIAELTGFGFPTRILHDPEIQAQTSNGSPALYDFLIKPAPVPSYASEKLYAEFACYLDALFAVVRPHLYPRGRVLGFQADNEMSYFFRPAMFDLDYAPSSLRLYQQFLTERYGDIGELNRVYRRHFRRFSEIRPPTAFKVEGSTDWPYYFDWARYKEYYLLHGLERIATMLRERGAQELLVYHNYPGLVAEFPTTPYNSPFHLPQAETRLDLCGVDSYPIKETYRQLKSQVQYVSATSRLPFIPEFGSGVWPWVRPTLPDDQEFTTLALLMHGVKAINFYMLVERDRWLGSPIMRDGRRRTDYFDLYRHLNDFLKRTDALHFQKVTPIVLLANRDYERLAGLSALFVSPSRQFLSFAQPEVFLNEERWDFRHAIALESYQWQRDWDNTISRAGYTFDLADTDLPLERLRRYAVAVTPTFDFMSRETQEKLVTFLREGGTLVFGPEVPYLDENMQRCSIVGEYLSSEAVRERAIFMPEPASLPDLPELLSKLGITPRVRVNDPTIDVTVHQFDSRHLIYLANPSAEHKTVSLTPGGRFRDHWTGETLTANAIFLPSYVIRVLEPVADD
jgi:beta-galactosidase